MKKLKTETATNIQLLLATCRDQLLESRRAIDNSVELINACIAGSAEGAEQGIGAGDMRQLFESLKAEVLATALAAVGNNGGHETRREEARKTDLCVVTQERMVLVGRRRLHLTDTEYDVLELLWNSMPGVVSREAILDRLYGQSKRPGERTIDVFVSHIRQKLKLASDGVEFIEAVRGQGWTLRLPNSDAQQSMVA